MLSDALIGHARLFDRFDGHGKIIPASLIKMQHAA
jgi:hypothetical protein